MIQKVQLSNMLSNDPGPDSSPLFGRTAQLFTVFTPVGKLPRLNACPGTNDCSWDVGQGKTSWINRRGKKERETGHKAPIPHHIALPHQSEDDSDVADGDDDDLDACHHQSQRGWSSIRRCKRASKVRRPHSKAEEKLVKCLYTPLQADEPTHLIPICRSISQPKVT